jgi:hypothetical protein
MLPILPPIGLRLLNVSLLTVFVPATEEHHDCPAMLAEIHAVAGAEEQSKFADPFPDGRMIPVVALGESSHPREDALTPYPIP